MTDQVDDGNVDRPRSRQHNYDASTIQVDRQQETGIDKILSPVLLVSCLTFPSSTATASVRRRRDAGAIVRQSFQLIGRAWRRPFNPS
jgi:hypothetical protein